MNKISQKHLAIIAIVISSLLWSTAGVSAKILLRVADPFAIAFLRFTIASIIILPFFVRKIQNNHYQWKKIILISFIGAVNAPLFYLGLTTTTANSAQLIYAGCPLFTMILAYYLINERTSIIKFIGIIIGLIGVLVIILLPVLRTNNNLIGDLKGNIYIAIGMLCWSVYTVLCRQNFNHTKTPPLIITSVFFYISVFITLLFTFIFKQNVFPKQLFQPLYFSTLLYSAIFITVITYFLYQWAIQRISTTTASLKNYLEPMFGIWLNILILGEIINLGFIFASTLIIFGIIISTNIKSRFR